MQTSGHRTTYSARLRLQAPRSCLYPLLLPSLPLSFPPNIIFFSSLHLPTIRFYHCGTNAQSSKSQLKAATTVNTGCPSIPGCFTRLRKVFLKIYWSLHLGEKLLLLGNAKCVYCLLASSSKFTLFIVEGEGEDEEGGDWLRLSTQPIWEKMSTLK